MSKFLLDLPNELIFQILLYVSPSSTPTLQLVCRKFNDLTQPLLWKYHCRTQFRYWNAEHCIQEKFSDNAAEINWKKVFSDRHTIDKTADYVLNSILSSQLGRIEKSERIVKFGYDTKDTLLRNIFVENDSEDVLARRYYSDALLGCLHRTLAIKEWVNIKDGYTVPLERALGAFDMFVLQQREEDFDGISAQLDHIAQSILIESPGFVRQSSRQKATIIAAYMKRNNLTGTKSNEQYHDLRNNFIGIALSDADHSSMPLVSVAIYCCVARRLNINASPCSLPFHSLAIVKPEKGKDLNGSYVDFPSGAELLYMDPFRSDQEISIADLQAQLSAMGVTASDYPALLGPSTTADIVRRTARSIIASVQIMPRSRGHNRKMTSLYPDADSAFYGALWALLLLPDGNPMAASMQRTRYLPYLVEHIENSCLMDVRLIQDHILPLFQNLEQCDRLTDSIRAIRAVDSGLKDVKRRTTNTAHNVKYHVGQVFKHRRYDYEAIITGWDAQCEASDEWMTQMGVADLPQGKRQSFYRVLVEDETVRYVAEENIEILQSRVSFSLLMLAGRHFKRWDDGTKTFISNIEDEYPDD